MVADLHDRAPASMVGWCRTKIERITNVVRAENDSAGEQGREKTRKSGRKQEKRIADRTARSWAKLPREEKKGEKRGGTAEFLSRKQANVCFVHCAPSATKPATKLASSG